MQDILTRIRNRKKNAASMGGARLNWSEFQNLEDDAVTPRNP